MRHTLALAALLAPAAALAHAGHGAPSGFWDGALHPLVGADHLLAMVAVGLWAALAGGTARLAYPAAFLGAMIAGSLLGFGGIALPAMEPVILASVLVLGAATALALRLPAALACTCLALFGLMHGNAHGLEATAGGLAYVAGFALATALLHGAGLALALGIPGATRILGAATALGGAALAFA